MRIGAHLRAIIKGCQRRPPLRKKKAALTLTSVWPLWLIVGFLVTVCVSAGWYSWTTLSGTSSRTDVQDVALKEGQDLRISLNQLESGRLYSFHYSETPNPQNQFVVQRASDGSLAVTRATCRACYSSAHDHYLSNAGLVCGRSSILCTRRLRTRRLPTMGDVT